MANDFRRGEAAPSSAPQQPPPPPLELNVGDRVVYPNQGLCLVTDIKTEQIAGQTLTFVSLVFNDTGARVKVPKEKLAKNGVRRVAGVPEAKEVLDYLKSDTAAPSLNWKVRAKENVDSMGRGQLIDLARVVKGHYDTAGLHALPPKEREQYNDSRDLLVAELAVALSITEADAEDMIDVILFPVGKERPKRDPAEFNGGVGAAGGDDDLDFLGLDDEAAPAATDEEKPEAEGEGEEAEGDGDEEEGGKKKPTKIALKVPKKTVMSDDEATQAQTAALSEALPLPKKRGRPPKPKPAVEVPAVPKKRGRPPKPKPEVEVPAVPKKRGRPPKPK